MRSLKATDIGKLLAASFMFTTMRLLPGVGTVVDGQCTSLNKSFGASSMGTVIRTFIGMYAIMSLEIRFAVKALIRHSQPLFGLGAAVRPGDCILTFGQSSQVHSNGRPDCMPVESSRSETDAFAIGGSCGQMVVRDRAILGQCFWCVLLGRTE